MAEITLADVERAIKAVTDTALRNEQYFSELDSAAGDADFGVSLASGFKVIQKDWDEIDRSSIGNFLLKLSMIIARNVGGCSGPIWGTGFMRAGALSKEKTAVSLAELEQMLAAAIDGIQQRGGAKVGDKTLIDALVPVREKLAEYADKPDADPREVLREATAVATESIARTRDWVARRGRQSFTGERSIGSPDPGIVAIATMMNDICKEVGVETTAASEIK